MLHIHNLHFAIGNKSILKGVEAFFEKGKVYGILGKNGAGKTTFFRTLFGFYHAQQGNISYKEGHLEKNKISFLETENYLYPYMRGIEYLLLINKNKQQIEKWNRIFDLPLQQLTQEYSTGMKKKLAFMGVLIQDREIMLLDEPFNGVDLESNEKIISIINQLKGNKTLLVSSHILSTLSEISDHIFVMDEGQFVERIDEANFPGFEMQLKKDIQNTIDDLLQS